MTFVASETPCLHATKVSDVRPSAPSLPLLKSVGTQHSLRLPTGDR